MIRRATAGSRRGSAGASHFLLFVILVVSIYIVDIVNYIGLYIQLVILISNLDAPKYGYIV